MLSDSKWFLSQKGAGGGVGGGGGGRGGGGWGTPLYKPFEDAMTASTADIALTEINPHLVFIPKRISLNGTVS